MTDNNIKHYQTLAARWVAEENGDMLVADTASETGWSVCASLTEDERTDLLTWVREYTATRATSMDHYPKTIRQAALMCCVAKALGIDFFMAACLCEAAGWP